MVKVRWSSMVLLVSVLAVPMGAHADDQWELNGEGTSDDDSNTRNQLVHGGKQTHDGQGTGAGSTIRDFDYIRVATRVRHSYEARVSGSALTFTNGTCAECAQFDRVDLLGTVLQASVAIDGSTTFSRSSHQVLRWLGTATQQEFIRVAGLSGYPTGPNDRYDVELFDIRHDIFRAAVQPGGRPGHGPARPERKQGHHPYQHHRQHPFLRRRGHAPGDGAALRARGRHPGREHGGNSRPGRAIRRRDHRPYRRLRSPGGQGGGPGSRDRLQLRHPVPADSALTR
jgi:hypothetical protein